MRITRGKKAIAAAGVPFALPPAAERRERLRAVLSVIYELITSNRLPGSHLASPVRGDLLARLGRRAEARAEPELAARLCTNQRERSVLLRKATTLS